VSQEFANLERREVAKSLDVCQPKKQAHFLLTSHTFFRTPCTLFGAAPLPKVCRIGGPSLDDSACCTSPLFVFAASPLSDGCDRLLSTLLQYCAGLDVAVTLLFSLVRSVPKGAEAVSSSPPNIVRDWLSVPVCSCVLSPSDRTKRVRRDCPDPEPGVAVEDGCDLNIEEPGRRGFRFRHMCQIMGRFVQRIPPRGSKAEYAPRGT
jgi:hypothetical protein